MDIHWGYKLQDDKNRVTYCIELLTNQYRLRDMGLNQFECIRTGLLDRKFTQNQIDLCLFTRGSIEIVLYIDDVIVISKKAANI